MVEAPHYAKEGLGWLRKTSNNLHISDIITIFAPEKRYEHRKDMITTINQQSTEISTVDALWVLIQGQTKAVRKALMKRLLAEQDKTTLQKTMVKESLNRAFDELHSGKVHHDARSLFKK